VLCGILGPIGSGLFGLMLHWMTHLRDRGWSLDPAARSEQIMFVLTVTAVVIVG
jgi:hypothetical protein